MTSPVRPAVSVLMPVLDPDPVFFPLAVRSVLEQTLGNLELIIVEDPSSVSGKDLLVGQADARIRHIVNPRRTSFAEQLNLGLKEARADLVARMDADDVCEPNRLERQVAVFVQNPELGVLGSQLTVIDEKGERQGLRHYPAAHAEIMRALPRYNPLAHPAVMFRKDAVVAAGGYQQDMYVADYDLWCRLALRGVVLGNSVEPLLRYRIHPRGMKSARLRDMIRATIRLKKQYWAGRMDLGARLRLWGERFLLLLPPRLVLRLFLRWTCAEESR